MYLQGKTVYVDRGNAQSKGKSLSTNLHYPKSSGEARQRRFIELVRLKAAASSHAVCFHDPGKRRISLDKMDEQAAKKAQVTHCSAFRYFGIPVRMQVPGLKCNKKDPPEYMDEAYLGLSVAVKSHWMTASLHARWALKAGQGRTAAKQMAYRVPPT